MEENRECSIALRHIMSIWTKIEKEKGEKGWIQVTFLRLSKEGWYLKERLGMKMPVSLTLGCGHIVTSLPKTVDTKQVQRKDKLAYKI